MFMYGAIMLMGIVAGATCSFIPAESKTRDRLQRLFLFVLLFVLGHQLGSDDAVVASVSEMGFYGVVIALASMLGSFSFVLILRKMLQPKGERGGND